MGGVRVVMVRVWDEGGNGEEGVGGVRVVMVRRMWEV